MLLAALAARCTALVQTLIHVHSHGRGALSPRCCCAWLTCRSRGLQAWSTSYKDLETLSDTADMCAAGRRRQGQPVQPDAAVPGGAAVGEHQLPQKLDGHLIWSRARQRSAAGRTRRVSVSARAACACVLDIRRPVR